MSNHSLIADAYAGMNEPAAYMGEHKQWIYSGPDDCKLVSLAREINGHARVGAGHGDRYVANAVRMGVGPGTFCPCEVAFPWIHVSKDLHDALWNLCPGTCLGVAVGAACEAVSMHYCTPAPLPRIDAAAAGQSTAGKAFLFVWRTLIMNQDMDSRVGWVRDACRN